MKKWLIAISVAINLLLIAGILGLTFFGSQLVTYVFMGPMYERWVSQFEALPVSAGDTVFLGDSITEGGIWEELFPELPVRNRGISGDTTDGVLKRLYQITDGKPARVFLLIGTNDLSRGTTPTEVADNINHIVDTIRAESPITRIYVQSVLPRGADYQGRIEELNKLLENTITDRATWINLYPLFLNTGDNSIDNKLSNDELHLLGGGYLLWREAIAGHL